MMTHTPTPWKIANGVDIQAGPQGCLAYVSTAGARGRTYEEAEANAEFIVRACNAHEDLLAACIALLEIVYVYAAKEGEFTWNDREDAAAAYEIGYAAIAKAKGA